MTAEYSQYFFHIFDFRGNCYVQMAKAKHKAVFTGYNKNILKVCKHKA